jgi:hypothetical protein
MALNILTVVVGPDIGNMTGQPSKENDMLKFAIRAEVEPLENLETAT